MLNDDADAAEDVEKKCVGVRESVCRLCPLMHYASRISSPSPNPDQTRPEHPHNANFANTKNCESRNINKKSDIQKAGGG